MTYLYCMKPHDTTTLTRIIHSARYLMYNNPGTPLSYLKGLRLAPKGYTFTDFR